MQFQDTISIDAEIIQAIRANSDSKNELLLTSLNDQKEKIVSVLNSYNHFDGTLGEIYDCDIDEDSLDINNNGKGTFRVDFIIYYYFGCDDINKEYEQEMAFTLDIDFNNQEAEVIGAFWDERQDDDV